MVKAIFIIKKKSVWGTTGLDGQTNSNLRALQKINCQKSSLGLTSPSILTKEKMETDHTRTIKHWSRNRTFLDVRESRYPLLFCFTVLGVNIYLMHTWILPIFGVLTQFYFVMINKTANRVRTAY